jgi:hypothetical protein
MSPGKPVRGPDAAADLFGKRLGAEDADVEHDHVGDEAYRHDSMHHRHAVGPERLLGTVVVLAQRQRQALPRRPGCHARPHIISRSRDHDRLRAGGRQRTPR